MGCGDLRGITLEKSDQILGSVMPGNARNPEQRALPALRTAPLPAQSSPASQQSGDGGLPGKKIALDLQLTDLAVQIVDHFLRIRAAGALLPRRTAPPHASPAPASSC
jgi:hypothetical protein